MGNFPVPGLNLDVRVFQEQLRDLISQSSDPVTKIKYYANQDNFEIHGFEYQLKWKPWTGGQLVLNQAFIRNNSKDNDHEAAAPTVSNSIVFSQKLSHGLNLSLMHQNSSLAALPGYNSSGQKTSARTDVRLSAPLRFGAQKGEVALVVQNLGAPYADFSPRFQFERRAFVTLRVEH